MSARLATHALALGIASTVAAVDAAPWVWVGDWLWLDVGASVPSVGVEPDLDKSAVGDVVAADAHGAPTTPRYRVRSVAASSLYRIFIP